MCGHNFKTCASIVSGNLQTRAGYGVAVRPDIPADVSRRAAFHADATVGKLEGEFAGLRVRETGFDQGFLSGIGWIHVPSMRTTMNGI